MRVVARASKADQVFGEIALKNKLLTKAQIDECVKALEKQERGAKSLGEVVEKRGLLSSRAVASIARAQSYREVRLDAKLYARIAVKSKFAEVLEVRKALEAQKKAYLTGDAPPDVGELLVKQGAVTSDEDRAIRDAMAKLDKESLIGNLSKGGGDDDLDLEGAPGEDGAEDADAEPAPKKPSGRAEKPSGRAAKRSGRAEKQDSGRAGGPKSAGSSRRAKERAAVMVDEEILQGSEEAQAEAADPSEGEAELAKAEAPLKVDTQAIDLEDVAGAVEDAKSLSDAEFDSASSISDSTSGRSAAPIEELVQELHEEPAPDRPRRAEETHDLMDVVMAPGDLAPLGDRPPEEAAERSAEGPAKRKSDSGEKGSVIEVPKLASSPGEATECPRCNVRIEPNVMECLYCGYKVPGGGSSRKSAQPAAPSAESGRGGAAAPVPATEAPAPAAKAEAPSKGFDGELTDAALVASCCRFDVLRAKDAKRKGAPCVALALPAGVTPDAEQLAAFQADAAAVKKLGLLHVLHLERVATSGGRTLLVYEDAPGKTVTERVKAAPLDRMKAARVVRELAAALGETVKAGLFSRELRPEAIILTDGDAPSPRLAGYGAARLTEPPAAGALAEESLDAFVPPERVKKPDRADARTELFGMGALLKLLLSGNAPTGKEPKQDLPDAPGGLKTVLTKTLDPASGKRFLEFGKLLEELEKAPGVKGTTVETRR